jgi:hypothetical protein
MTQPRMSSLIAPDQDGRKIKPNTATSGKHLIAEIAKSGRLVIASSLPGPWRPSFVPKGRPHPFFARRSVLRVVWPNRE